MSWFAESPWPGLTLGLLLAVVMIAGFLRTGRRWLLALSIVFLLLGAALVWLEARIVTDREQITTTIHDLARALVQGDDQRILDAIHRLAPEIRDRAQSELHLYDFTRVDIKHNLRVEVSPDHQPPRAEAKFNVVVELKQYPSPIPRFVTLEFFREPDGIWRIHPETQVQPQSD